MQGICPAQHCCSRLMLVKFIYFYLGFRNKLLILLAIPDFLS